MIAAAMLRCVIFDLDNTLVDSSLDFARIKREIGTDQPILEHRATVDEAEQRRIDEILDRHESASAETCALLEGARELLGFLEARGIRTALLTRNSRKAVRTVLTRHGLRFDSVLSREDGPPKPSPEPVLRICDELNVCPRDCIMVGDYLFDIQAGQAAGTRTMLLDGPNRGRFEIAADYEVADLGEALETIRDLLRNGD